MRSSCFSSMRTRSFEHQLDELDEIRQAIEESGLDRGAFLAQAFSPLNQRIAAVRGELIAIHTRLYEQMDFSSNPDDETLVTLEERTQAGLITEKTRIPTCAEERAFDAELISGVRVVYPQDALSLLRTSFSVLLLQQALPTLYFRNRPPVAKGKTFFEIKERKPRLELYIGDAEALPYLQSRLKGYEYVELRRLSGRDLPLSPQVEKKIREEQLETYEGVQHALQIIAVLTQKRDARLDAISQQGGEAAFDHGTHVELADEFTEKMRWNPEIGKAQDSLARHLYQARSWQYNTEGLTILIESDVGVKTEIDMKKYFSHMLEKYAPLLQLLQR